MPPASTASAEVPMEATSTSTVASTARSCPCPEPPPPARPVRPRPPTLPKPERDLSATAAALQEAARDLRRCTLGHGPRMTAHLRVEVEPSGMVSAVAVVNEGERPPPPVEACVREGLRGLALPGFAGPPAVFSLSLEL